ncbi:hypothetical protein [Pseudomonas putida]|uniref:hypothetical protein n=1 Tax=Pseudomonas putida TaxID=303 RepID=UPI000C9BB18E|nr:hypothetical protein [Pseudomonas putida]PNG87583.1 hypothetical protein CBL13_01447 [Pseudomonas putida]
MAEEKTGVAKHSADYRKRQKAQAKKLGIEKVFFNMPEGIKAAMAAEIERHGYDQVQELWQDLALSWIAQDSEERARRLERPDAPAFYISPKLARQFEEQSLRDLRRDPGDEIVPPDL